MALDRELMNALSDGLALLKQAQSPQGWSAGLGRLPGGGAVHAEIADLDRRNNTAQQLVGLPGHMMNMLNPDRRNSTFGPTMQMLDRASLLRPLEPVLKPLITSVARSFGAHAFNPGEPGFPINNQLRRPPGR